MQLAGTYAWKRKGCCLQERLTAAQTALGLHCPRRCTCLACSRNTGNNTCAVASTASEDLNDVAFSGLLFCWPSSESTSLVLVPLVDASDMRRIYFASGRAEDACDASGASVARRLGLGGGMAPVEPDLSTF